MEEGAKALEESFWEEGELDWNFLFEVKDAFFVVEFEMG